METITPTSLPRPSWEVREGLHRRLAVARGRGARSFGLDLTAGRRPSGYAVLDRDGQLLDLGSVLTDHDILALAERHDAGILAVDSPLGLPLGIDCFDETHDCAPASGLKGKASERALAALGIPCYYTGKRSIIRTMIERAMTLASQLASRGHDVIEVYPYSVKVRLWCNCPPPRHGCRHIPSKTTRDGMAFLHHQLNAMFPNLNDVLAAPNVRFTHDIADALLAAYTAHLYRRGQTEALGHPEEGYIIVPRAV